LNSGIQCGNKTHERSCSSTRRARARDSSE
jgi:hypothetical protein